MSKTTPIEEAAYVGSQKANVYSEIRAKSSMNQTRKAKRKGRPRSLSPTVSPHRNSKGDGKGSDDGSAEGTPKFSGRSPSGKANRLLRISFKKGSCQKRNSQNYWHFLNLRNANLQSDARSKTSVFTNTQLNLLVKNSATVATHLTANEERKLQLQKVQSDDKTQFRGSPTISRTCVF